MKPKLKILLLLMTIIALNSCDGGCAMFLLDDGDIEGPQHSTWICTINSDGTGLHYLREGGGNAQFTVDGSNIILGLSNGFKILDAELGTVLVDIDTLSYFSHYSVSDDNTICFRAFCELTQSTDLHVYDINSSEIIKITSSDSIFEAHPCYSNNSDKIVYKNHNFPTLNQLLIFDLINQQSMIISENIGYRYPQFSEDDSQIIFGTYSQKFYKIDLNTMDCLVIFEGSTDDYPCSIFENDMTFSSGYNIMKMEITGDNLTELGQGENPQFSPDGSKIAFDGLYIMNSDGTNKQKLTDELGEYPHFSPDGSKIVFLMERYEE